MGEAEQKLFRSHVDARLYGIRHTLQRTVVTALSILFFAFAVAIGYLALFYSDDLTHAVGDCIGYRDGWAQQPCPQAIRNLFQRVQAGEPKNFFNL